MRFLRFCFSFAVTTLVWTYNGSAQPHNQEHLSALTRGILSTLSTITIDTSRIATLCELSSACVNRENDAQLGQYYALQALALAEALNNRPYQQHFIMRALKALGNACSHTPYPECLTAEQYFNRAIAIANTLNDKKSIAYILRWWLYALRDRIILHNLNDEPLPTLRAKAFAVADRCEAYADSTGDQGMRASCLTVRGLISSATGEYARAIEYIFQSQSMYEAIGDQRRAAFCWLHIGSVAVLDGDYPRAMAAHLKALHIADSLNLWADKGSYLRGIGDAYRSQGDSTRALLCYQQSKDLLKQFGDRNEYIRLLESIGQVHQTQRRFDSAQMYYRLARDEHSSVRNEHGIYQLRIGSLLLAQNTPHEALDSLFAGFALYGSISDIHRFEFLFRIASAYKALNDWQHGIEYATQAFSFAESKKSPELTLAAARLLAELHKTVGNYAEALRYYERYTACKDSLYSFERSRAMAIIEARGVLENRQNHIQHLEREAAFGRIIQYGLGASVVGAIIFAAIILLRYREQKNTDEALNEQNSRLNAANEELQYINQELDEANQFRMKMLTMASHDLKNPLSGIIGAAEIIRREALPTSITAKMANRINTIGWRMFTLINDLLDTAARDLGMVSLQLELVDLAALFHRVYKRYKHDAIAKQQTIAHKGDEHLMLTADPERLMQVIDNLLSNAIKYSPPNSTITVSWQELEKGDGMRVARLAIQDQGPGFSEADQQKAFQFFQKLSAQPTGGESSSGVGLAIAKQIIDQHGGRIWVENNRAANGNAPTVRTDAAHTGDDDSRQEPKGRIFDSTFGSTFIIELPITHVSMPQDTATLHRNDGRMHSSIERN